MLYFVLILPYTIAFLSSCGILLPNQILKITGQSRKLYYYVFCLHNHVIIVKINYYFPESRLKNTCDKKLAEPDRRSRRAAKLHIMNRFRSELLTTQAHRSQPFCHVAPSACTVPLTRHDFWQSQSSTLLMRPSAATNCKTQNFI